MNSCGNKAENIEIKNDSIYLKLVDTVRIACTSERVVDRLKYKIKNSENKKIRNKNGRRANKQQHVQFIATKHYFGKSYGISSVSFYLRNLLLNS